MRRIIAICLVFIMGIVFSACGNKDGNSGGNTADFVNDDGVEPMYGQLNDTEKKLYDQITADITEGKTEYVFKNIEVDTVSKAYLAVVADHPEFFWVNGGYSCSTQTLGDEVTITFTSNCDLSREQINSRNEALKEVVNEILTEAKALSDDYSKIKFVHDYIVNATTYDEAAYEKIMASSMLDQTLDATTAYGCLVSKRAVCSGYAAAFQFLMQELGIRCGRVSGYKIGGESHEWNYLLLDDEYYFIDVTWDDPVSKDKTQALLTYEYFLIDEEELLLTHTIDSDQIYPACNGKDMNYHKVNGLYLEEYSLEGVKNIVLKKGIDEGIEIKFSSNKEQKSAVEDLFEDGRIFEIPGFENEVSYSVGNSGLILTLYSK